jgi:Ca2+-binding EF-hand superfamily protein
LKKAFEKADKNGDGEISRDECKDLLEALGEERPDDDDI